MTSRIWAASATASPSQRAADIQAFHESLPEFRRAPLFVVDSLARTLGVDRVYVKHERDRLGLPSFKVLGASWAINCEIARRRGQPAPRDFETTRRLAARLPAGTTLTTATEGNHGRGVAHVARLLDLPCRIYVPAGTARSRIDAIEIEGASVDVIDGSYDDAVRFAAAEAECTAALMLVSDTAWRGYEEIPHTIGEGYGTLFRETFDQLAELGETHVDVAFVPAGVGALAAAAVAGLRAHGTAVVTVEPAAADCVRRSLEARAPVTVPGPHRSLMGGLNCGEISRLAWPVLRDGVRAALAVTDEQAIAAMRALAAAGIASGASGAAALAGALAYAGDGGSLAEREGWRSVLLVATEGVTDPDAYRTIVNAPS